MRHRFDHQSMKHHGISTPPIFTITASGKGEMLAEFVIRGTALRPRSDDEYVSIVRSAAVRVSESVVNDIWRSIRLN
jgi:hypothetical protein